VEPRNDSEKREEHWAVDYKMFTQKIVEGVLQCYSQSYFVGPCFGGDIHIAISVAL